jgi:hypothetical protein
MAKEKEVLSIATSVPAGGMEAQLVIITRNTRRKKCLPIIALNGTALGDNFIQLNIRI